MRLACVQTNVAFNDPSANLVHAKSKLEEAKNNGAELVMFPECFLTGYCVSTRHEAEQIALRAHCNRDYDVTDCDTALTQIQALAIDLDLHIVCGYAGKDDFGLYNGALLAEPNGRMRRYIKTHLPCLGFDQFVEPGQDLPVFQTDLGSLGILICYDLRAPEASRVLALRGAELILLPTNWPTRKGTTPALMCPSRAMENKVFFASCNRIGDENGFSFRGESAIYDLSGAPIAEAGTADTIIYADLNLSEAHNKRTIVIPGVFETDAFECRRPELYSPITEQ